MSVVKTLRSSASSSLTGSPVNRAAIVVSDIEIPLLTLTSPRSAEAHFPVPKRKVYSSLFWLIVSRQKTEVNDADPPCDDIKRRSAIPSHRSPEEKSEGSCRTSRLITGRTNNELEKTSLNCIGGRRIRFCSRAPFRCSGFGWNWVWISGLWLLSLWVLSLWLLSLSLLPTISLRLLWAFILLVWRTSVLASPSSLLLSVNVAQDINSKADSDSLHYATITFANRKASRWVTCS